MVAWMFRNPRRTRAGVSRPGGAGRSHGRRRSSARGRARRSWAWAVMISQVQRSAAGWVAEFRGGPPQDLFKQPEGVLKIKPAQERLPQPVHLRGRGAGRRAPQPQRLGGAVTGQVIHLQADQGALDDRQRAVVVSARRRGG